MRNVKYEDKRNPIKMFLRQHLQLFLLMGTEKNKQLLQSDQLPWGGGGIKLMATGRRLKVMEKAKSPQRVRHLSASFKISSIALQS